MPCIHYGWSNGHGQVTLLDINKFCPCSYGKHIGRQIVTRPLWLLVRIYSTLLTNEICLLMFGCRTNYLMARWIMVYACLIVSCLLRPISDWVVIYRGFWRPHSFLLSWWERCYVMYFLMTGFVLLWIRWTLLLERATLCTTLSDFNGNWAKM